eukprot:CAMPEP_0195075578 /NCGR_PEP_ID=MMETSP0448-20130528/18421_1 /TAXON_ID=66468 /ORGANISM="Heterocapsa triquestra, Strain CCMP 448" /LENGTH=69 /DNA_ID=CAMNT_0040107975 /DNA_START=16 /DNA_END=222 /DNA_ORIENTATION=+
MSLLPMWLALSAMLLTEARAAECPGDFDVPGYGKVSLIPTGWGKDHSETEVRDGGVLVPHMGARAYFAD